GGATAELIFARADGPARLVSWTGTGLAPAIELAASATRTIATGDFDGDGRADLALGRSGSDADEVLLNTSTTTPSFFHATELGSAPTVTLLIEDFDADG